MAVETPGRNRAAGSDYRIIPYRIRRPKRRAITEKERKISWIAKK